MKAWKRWQDYGTMLWGVLLFISPFAFSETHVAAAVWSGVVMGVIIFLAGVWCAAVEHDHVPEWVALIGGVVAFFLPWLAGYATSAMGTAWSSWVLGVLTVLTSGVLLLPHSHTPAAVAH